jgi:hypothetical protein
MRRSFELYGNARIGFDERRRSTRGEAMNAAGKYPQAWHD